MAVSVSMDVQIGKLVEFHLDRCVSIKLFNRYTLLMSKAMRGDETRTPNRPRTWLHVDGWTGGDAAATLELGMLTFEAYDEPERPPSPLSEWAANWHAAYAAEEAREAAARGTPTTH